MLTYTRPRLSATALGLLCAGVTLKVLLAGVTAPSDITTGHAISITVLIITIVGGHMLWPAVRGRRLFPALGLVLLLAASTVYLVTASAGRNAASAEAKAAKTRSDNQARGRLEEAIADARERLARANDEADQARREANAECRSGKKTKCEGSTFAHERAEAAAKDIEARIALDEAHLRLMNPVTTDDAELRYAATVFASLPGVSSDTDEILARLRLWMPFGLTLILELGTIVFLGLGIPKTQRQRLPRFPETIADGNRPWKSTSSHPVLAALSSAGGAVGSNRELARLMKVTDGEASKRWREVADLLEIVRDGRECRISLRQSCH